MFHLALLAPGCAPPADDSGAPDPWEPPPFAELPASAEPPSLFRMVATGETVTDSDGWESRRAPEIGVLFAHYVYGFAPETIAVTTIEVARQSGGLDGLADVVEFEVAIGPVVVGVVAFLPAGRSGPHPWMVGLNKCGNHTLTDAAVAVPTSWPDPACADEATEAGRGSHAAEWPIADALARGIAVVSFAQSDIDPDDADPAARDGGVRGAFATDAEDEHAWGTIAAWSWGFSRVLDGLESSSELDFDRVLAFGHSRRGKTALWTAAQDSRIDAVWAHQSGIVGAALDRDSVGETVAAINTLFPHWFAPQFAAFGDAEERLPVDQHMLLALASPRPVLVTDGDDDTWANPPGAVEAVGLASPAWALYGGGAVGWQTRPGGHEMTAADWAIALEWWEAG